MSSINDPGASIIESRSELSKDLDILTKHPYPIQTLVVITREFTPEALNQIKAALKIPKSVWVPMYEHKQGFTDVYYLAPSDHVYATRKLAVEVEPEAKKYIELDLRLE